MKKLPLLILLIALSPRPAQAQVAHPASSAGVPVQCEGKPNFPKMYENQLRLLDDGIAFWSKTDLSDLNVVRFDAAKKIWKRCEAGTKKAAQEAIGINIPAWCETIELSIKKGLMHVGIVKNDSNLATGLVFLGYDDGATPVGMLSPPLGNEGPTVNFKIQGGHAEVSLKDCWNKKVMSKAATSGPDSAPAGAAKSSGAN